MCVKEGEIMAGLINTVETEIQKYPENQVIVANELYKKVATELSEQNFYKSLERLHKSGKLAHLTKGLYYRPKVGRFGQVPISEKEIVHHYIKNNRGVMIGYRMYNEKGITSQISKRTEILSSALSEEKKNIQNVLVRKASVALTGKTIPVIEMLEILQDYRNIEDINKKALLTCINAFAEKYSDKAANAVLTKMKYKKSTIAFMAAVLNHLHVPHTLDKYLSPLSDYKIPNVEVLYESA